MDLGPTDLISSRTVQALLSFQTLPAHSSYALSLHHTCFSCVVVPHAGTGGVATLCFVTWLVTRLRYEARRADEWNAALLSSVPQGILEEEIEDSQPLV